MRAPEVLAGGEAFRLAREEISTGARFTLSGDVDAASAEMILRALEEKAGEGEAAEFLLEEAEITDGPAAARMVDAARLLLARFRRVRLVRAPQALAHSLYRVGMLRPGSRIEMVEPREEEGRAN
ncbi:MAG: hypothetical protein HYZ11_07530 [Candidatus Tectomicrobia bacterium]|uniref:STAS domain-containing protein n=1 Tax=Tectimicrobiota bacterium TaxID=2528274 RepID=A0A932HXC4_UNCTE|nr:hypothetical protein [Candidatus Tectomicrobia bacterium]